MVPRKPASPQTTRRKSPSRAASPTRTTRSTSTPRKRPSTSGTSTQPKASPKPTVRKKAATVVTAPAPVAEPLKTVRPTALFKDDIWIRELSGAVDSELDEFSRRLDEIFDDIKREIRGDVESLRKAVGEAVEQKVESTDAVDTLVLAAELEKLAKRLMEYRQQETPDIDSVKKMTRRLTKARRRMEG